ncbi:MAG TPA: D-2-hydroxyacid dehydrogenase family protein [Hyphomicrobiaceae bacterium]|nr:D-2-hydroxyacid dehydrogenase family protein [Hyphomicrobiaceae bacterium]
MRIVIPDDITGSYRHSPDTARLKAKAEVEIHASPAASEGELVARIREADVVLSFRPAFTRFPASVISACQHLRMICISGTGVEDVDVAEATRRGIAVSNVVGSSNRAVAEHALALMLDVSRRVSEQDRAIRGGTWLAQQGIELGGKTLGIIGLSAIAQSLIPLGAGIGMRVLSWSRNNDPQRARAAGATAVELDELLAQSDVVSIHLRLFPQLTGFIGEKQIARMKPGAIFINTARGELVDEKALEAALQNGHLRGAGLDVFASQPLPPDHPLRRLPNVVMTPASAWNTVDASARMIGQSIDNVLAFIAGAPINVVNAAALENKA